MKINEKELKFEILKIEVIKEKEKVENKIFMQNKNYIKAKCLKDESIFEVYNNGIKDLREVENKELLRSILIEEYNKILSKKELSIKRIHEGDVI